jgi:hypothetical protein
MLLDKAAHPGRAGPSAALMMTAITHFAMISAAMSL